MGALRQEFEAAREASPCVLHLRGIASVAGDGPRTLVIALWRSYPSATLFTISKMNMQPCGKRASCPRFVVSLDSDHSATFQIGCGGFPPPWKSLGYRAHMFKSHTLFIITHTQSRIPQNVSPHLQDPTAPSLYRAFPCRCPKLTTSKRRRSAGPRQRRSRRTPRRLALHVLGRGRRRWSEVRNLVRRRRRGSRRERRIVGEGASVGPAVLHARGARACMYVCMYACIY